MIPLIEYGYLETPYLSEFPYGLPASEQGLALQTEFRIDVERELALQFTAEITKELALGTQFEGLILDSERSLALQTEFRVIAESILGLQASVVNTQEQSIGIQAQFAILKETLAGLQFDVLNTQDKPLGFQSRRLFQGKEKPKGVQFRKVKNAHYQCFGGGYLNEEPYLSEHYYLNPLMCVAAGFQFEPAREKKLAFQFRSALYNTTNLRILMDFPSRGTSGTNWTASSTQPSSTNSFSVNNINTDIVEQYWRSATGTTTSVTLSCDTELPQGVYLDTLAILNHNLTGSASIFLQGSSDPAFGTIPVNVELEYEASNMYYIAPTLPNDAYRYWRLEISDPGSSDNFLRIGTIVFGSSMIFSQESFVDRVRFGQKQFVDQVYTEGFTNVSNDRGKKRYLSLEFRNLLYGRANFNAMRSLFEYAGITLKCLYIPVPQQASRFAVFGKLSDIPAEEHNYKGADADYVDFSIEVDESL